MYHKCAVTLRYDTMTTCIITYCLPFLCHACNLSSKILTSTSSAVPYSFPTLSLAGQCLPPLLPPQPDSAPAVPMR